MPQLPDPQWRLILPASPATTASADVISTMKSQIALSSSYWRLVETPNTGTQTILLNCINPGPRPLYVVITGAITSSAAMLFAEVTSNLTNSLQFGLCVGSASFLGPQLSEPFGPSGSEGPFWTKYSTVGGTLANLSQSYFVESEETIFIGNRPSAGNSHGAAWAGAIIDSLLPNQGHDQRVYGLTSTGFNGALGTGLGAGSTSFPAGAQTTGAGRNCIVFLMTGSQVTNNITHLEQAFSKGANTNFWLTEATSSNSPTVFAPIFASALQLNSKHFFIGKFRGMYYTRFNITFNYWQQNGVNFAFHLYDNRSSPGQGITFAPLSGTLTLERVTR